MDHEKTFEHVVAVEADMRSVFERYMALHVEWTELMGSIESTPELRAKWIEWVESDEFRLGGTVADPGVSEASGERASE